MKPHFVDTTGLIAALSGLMVTIDWSKIVAPYEYAVGRKISMMEILYFNEKLNDLVLKVHPKLEMPKHARDDIGARDRWIQSVNIAFGRQVEFSQFKDKLKEFDNGHNENLRNSGWSDKVVQNITF